MLDWSIGFGTDLIDRETSFIPPSGRDLCFSSEALSDLDDDFFFIDPETLICTQIPGIMPDEHFVINILKIHPAACIVAIDLIASERQFTLDIQFTLNKILNALEDTKYARVEKSLKDPLVTIQQKHQFIESHYLKHKDSPLFLEDIIKELTSQDTIFQAHTEYMNRIIGIESLALEYSLVRSDEFFEETQGRTIMQLLRAPLYWEKNFASQGKLLEKALPETFNEGLKKEFSKFIKKLEDNFDTIDSIPKLEQISKQFLTEPFPIVISGRRFLKQGVANKHCRKDVTKRTIILFSDKFVYAQNKGGVLIKPVDYDIHQLYIAKPEKENIKKDFYLNVYAPKKSFILEFETKIDRDSWYNAIELAITNYGLKLSDIQANLQMAPIWLPDNDYVACMKCKSQFTLINRRHHCRLCGAVICKNCFTKRIAPSISDKPVPVCRDCVNKKAVQAGKFDP